MKCAIIPTHELVVLASLSDYHLVLPNEVEASTGYFTFYKQLPTGSHIILDNGVAEGLKPNIDLMYTVAEDLQVDEIVVPDVMGSADATIEAIRDFQSTAWSHPNYTYMGVAQGCSMKDVIHCIAFIANLAPWIKVLALPRILVKEIHQDVRINLARWVNKTFPGRFEAIHCLGASDYVLEPIALAHDGLVRGIDTSYPIVAALHDIDIDQEHKYISRPENYFKMHTLDGQSAIAAWNVNTYLGWCK